MSAPFRVCSCIGPAHDEPFCYCKMVAKGLPLNEPSRAEAGQRLDAVMGEIFGWQTAPEATLAGEGAVPDNQVPPRP